MTNTSQSRPHAYRRLIAGMGAAILALLISAAITRAGTYPVGSCQAAPADYSTRAFDGFANRGMSVRRACNPEGAGIRGLVTRNVLARNDVPRGAAAIVTMTAPAGTQFATFRWAGTARRQDCAYAIQLYAEGPGVKPVPVKNLRANQACPTPGRAQAAGYKARTFNIGGATRIVQRVICVGTRERRSCNARHNNYIQTYKATATITDTTGPAVNIIADTPLTQGAWVNGNQAISYDASDNVGVRAAHALLNGQPASGADDNRPCVLADSAGTFGAPAPCANGRGQIGVFNTTRVPEGTQSLQVQAEDTAGNPGTSAPVTARVDNTAPPRVDVGVVRGEAWRNTNDFALAWTNPYEGDRAPIFAARYSLCVAGTTNCTANEVGGLGISGMPVAVPAPGQWTVAVTRRDQAGNLDEHAASTPVTLRYDPEPPTLGFEPTAAADPTQVAVDVTDKVSGLAGGSIEISRQGSNVWQTLATRQDASRLLAQIDDAGLPAGAYVLRARAHDQAGNEASTDRRLDDQAMGVTLPVRVGTALHAGVAHTKTVRKRVGRRHHRHWVRRRVTELRSSAHSRLGQHVPIVGRLTAANGQGIPGAAIQVFAATPILGEVLVGVIQTDATGSYRYPATAASTAALRFSYAGSQVLLPAQDQVTVLVGAGSSLSVKPRRVLNGQAVRFRGRVTTLPVPAGGKLVELQAFVSGRWQTFSSGRSDPAGRWTIVYRFQRTRGTQHYRFRAHIPTEAGYAFQTGTSGSVTVQVKGR